jgi:excisionase family DNA binding protein
MSDPLDSYMTATEVSRRFGWARRNVVRWCKEGRLRAVLLGARYLVREADARAFTPPKRGPTPRRERPG